MVPLSYENYRARETELATDARARVMVFVDGQNMFKRCQDLFGHALMHPYLLAEVLSGSRTQSRVPSTRFYTGEPDRSIDNVEVKKKRQLDRRTAGMQKVGVTVIKRKLRYHWTWGPVRDERTTERMRNPGPNSGEVEVWMEAFRRAREKGVDLAMGLDVMEFALMGAFDVGIIVSLDRDLWEVPSSIKRVRNLLPGPVRIEAAVPVTGEKAKTLPGFAYTHQITRQVFDQVRDGTNYDAEPWTPVTPPRTLADVA